LSISVQILKQPAEVISHLNSIKEATDANRKALGFNPVGAYEDKINRGQIWVAVDEQGNYLGHIMFGGNPPHFLRIFQVYIDPASRGLGVAASLIRNITEHGEKLSCLNLRADVANDLIDAIKFWQSQGFCEISLRKRQNTSGRNITIFQKRLSTPSLFPDDSLSLSILEEPIVHIRDSYVIDLNIFITLVKNQTDKEIIAEIIKAALSGEFSIFVTPEFKVELERSRLENDLILDLAESTFPVLESISPTELEKLQDAVREIVFPQRTKIRKKATQDSSDLKHLAYCIKNSQKGFITQERALLRSKEKLKEKYGLTLFSPHDFSIEHLENIDYSPIDIPLSGEDGSILISDLTNFSEINSFTDELSPELEEVFKNIKKNNSRAKKENKIIYFNQEMCALYAAKTKGVRHDFLEGFFIVSDKGLESRESVFEHILECFMRLSQATKATHISFYVRAKDFDLEKICLRRGFQRSESAVKGMIHLIKIPCPILITKANWLEFRTKFFEDTKIKFPQLIPSNRKNSAGEFFIKATKDCQSHEVELFKLETMLSPSLILLPKRTGVIIPIHPTFASDLLSRSENLLPFPIAEEALLRIEKAYYRKPTHIKSFTVGMPIIFYESGKGRGVIGCARITSTNICSSGNAIKMYRKYGVLNENELLKYADRKGNIQVITFDNFKEFTRPISMKKLKELGCAKANLVGPEEIPHNQLFQILHEGMNIQTRDITISINPKYVTKILNGKKLIELRKKDFPANGGVRVWIYSTSPVSAIEATTFVSVVHKDTPSNIWKKFGNKCGISKPDFDTYFSNSEEAFALSLDKVEKLNKKVPLDKIKTISDGFTPPQYYRYIDHESDLFDFLINQVN